MDNIRNKTIIFYQIFRVLNLLFSMLCCKKNKNKSQYLKSKREKISVMECNEKLTINMYKNCYIYLFILLVHSSNERSSVFKRPF